MENKNIVISDLSIPKESIDDNCIKGSVAINQQTYTFDFNRNTEELELRSNFLNGTETPLPNIVTSNIVEISDKIVDAIHQSTPTKELPFKQDEIGTYKIPADKVSELNKVLNNKKIIHRFGKVNNSAAEKYVLFNKKFYPGVKVALNEVGIKKPPLHRRIQEAEEKLVQPINTRKELSMEK